MEPSNAAANPPPPRVGRCRAQRGGGGFVLTSPFPAFGRTSPARGEEERERGNVPACYFPLFNRGNCGPWSMLERAQARLRRTWRSIRRSFSVCGSWRKRIVSTRVWEAGGVVPSPPARPRLARRPRNLPMSVILVTPLSAVEDTVRSAVSHCPEPAFLRMSE